MPLHRPRFALCAGAVATTLVAAIAGASADEMPAMDPHAHHHHHDIAPTTTRSSTAYKLPAVTLTRDDGKSVRFADEIDDGRAVILAFIYTTCTTICPVTSATLAQVQARLGAEAPKVHIASVSIDPEQDTPARLAAYAKRFGAGPSWNHYTGTLDASVAVQRSFDAFRGDKMNHTPVVYVRKAPGQPWTRIDGFASADQILAEYKEMAASQ